VHRVKVPKAGVDRYSVAYFLQARLDAGAIPLLQLPSELAALARGAGKAIRTIRCSATSAKNAIKGRLALAPRRNRALLFPSSFAKLKAAGPRKRGPGF